MYVDYNPAIYAHKLLAARPIGGPEPPFEPKPGICTCVIASVPFASSGLQDQWWNNTCIASQSHQFFKFESCNSTNLTDGTIPFPMKTNHYYSSDSSYELMCNGQTWNLSGVQAQGVDLGSTLSFLPSDEDLVIMGHSLLGF